MDQISQLIKIKKDMGISSELMARDVGVSRLTLEHWLRRKAKPSLMGLARLQEYLDRQAARSK
jgi:transcriptional regulator with XRE-family HTH domain